jgi:hypothetical protein
VLDSFAPTGMSASASVYVPANQDTCAVESAGGADAVGTIVGLTTNSVTINIPGSGPMTFSVDPTGGVTDGNSVGDVVDVNYTPNADGTLAAGSLSWTEQYTTGTVTAATSNGLTVKDAVTGQPETFLANDAGFAGISRGDVVSVTYYVSGGALEADNVSDYTTGTNG